MTRAQRSWIGGVGVLLSVLGIVLFTRGMMFASVGDASRGLSYLSGVLTQASSAALWLLLSFLGVALTVFGFRRPKRNIP